MLKSVLPVTPAKPLRMHEVGRQTFVKITKEDS